MDTKTYMAVEDLDVYGLERTLEKKLPEGDRRWHVAEDHVPYGTEGELCPPGWPSPET